jgi:hypothetical protein
VHLWIPRFRSRGWVATQMKKLCSMCRSVQDRETQRLLAIITVFNTQVEGCCLHCTVQATAAHNLKPPPLVATHQRHYRGFLLLCKQPQHCMALTFCGHLGGGACTWD